MQIQREKRKGGNMLTKVYEKSGKYLLKRDIFWQVK